MLITQYKLKCDACGNCLVGDREESAAALVVRALAEGWERIESLKYTCPGCVTTMKPPVDTQVLNKEGQKHEVKPGGKGPSRPGVSAPGSCVVFEGPQPTRVFNSLDKIRIVREHDFLRFLPSNAVVGDSPVNYVQLVYYSHASCANRVACEEGDLWPELCFTCGKYQKAADEHPGLKHPDHLTCINHDTCVTGISSPSVCDFCESRITGH